MTKLEPHLSPVREADPILRHGRAQRVAAHALQPRAIAPRHDHAGMQIEPVLARVTRTKGG